MFISWTTYLRETIVRIRGIFTNIFRFLKRGTLWEPRFPNAAPTNPSRRFQTFPEFSSQCYGPYKTTFEILEILKIEILTIFFLFANIWTQWEWKFKTLLLQIAAKSFPISEFSSQWPSQNYVRDFFFFNFDLPICNDIFRKFQIHHCTLWKKI